MVVIKRDGREVNFDKSKIRDAAYRALCEVDHLHLCLSRKKTD